MPPQVKGEPTSPSIVDPAEATALTEGSEGNGNIAEAVTIDETITKLQAAKNDLERTIVTTLPEVISVRRIDSLDESLNEDGIKNNPLTPGLKELLTEEISLKAAALEPIITPPSDEQISATTESITDLTELESEETKARVKNEISALLNISTGDIEDLKARLRNEQVQVQDFITLLINKSRNWGNTLQSEPNYRATIDYNLNDFQTVHSLAGQVIYNLQRVDYFRETEQQDADIEAQNRLRNQLTTALSDDVPQSLDSFRTVYSDTTNRKSEELDAEQLKEFLLPSLVDRALAMRRNDLVRARIAEIENQIATLKTNQEEQRLTQAAPEIATQTEGGEVEAYQQAEAEIDIEVPQPQPENPAAMVVNAEDLVTGDGEPLQQEPVQEIQQVIETGEVPLQVMNPNGEQPLDIPAVTTEVKVPQETNPDIQELRDQIARLNNSVLNLSTENASLAASNSQFMTENAQLKEAENKLTEANLRLNNSNEALNAQIEEAASKITALEMSSAQRLEEAMIAQNRLAERENLEREKSLMRGEVKRVVRDIVQSTRETIYKAAENSKNRIIIPLNERTGVLGINNIPTTSSTRDRVSRTHLQYFIKSDGDSTELQIRDGAQGPQGYKRSTNGTMLNGERINANGEADYTTIKSGDMISLDAVTYIVVKEDETFNLVYLTPNQAEILKEISPKTRGEILVESDLLNRTQEAIEIGLKELSTEESSLQEIRKEQDRLGALLRSEQEKAQNLKIEVNSLNKANTMLSENNRALKQTIADAVASVGRIGYTNLDKAKNAVIAILNRKAQS